MYAKEGEVDCTFSSFSIHDEAGITAAGDAMHHPLL
jgi:hypothetical protein